MYPGRQGKAGTGVWGELLVVSGRRSQQRAMEGPEQNEGEGARNRAPFRCGSLFFQSIRIFTPGKTNDDEVIVMGQFMVSFVEGQENLLRKI